MHGWIADECSRSTVKNSLTVSVRVVEQALRDGIIDRNPARITGWQGEYQQFEDELDDPALARPAKLVGARRACRCARCSFRRPVPRLGHVAAAGESLSTFLAALIPRPVLSSGRDQPGDNQKPGSGRIVAKQPDFPVLKEVLVYALDLRPLRATAVPTHQVVISAFTYVVQHGSRKVAALGWHPLCDGPETV